MNLNENVYLDISAFFAELVFNILSQCVYVCSEHTMSVSYDEAIC
jgi:hypothetical protein